MQDSKIMRFLTRKITFFRHLNFILDGSVKIWKWIDEPFIRPLAKGKDGQ